MTAPDPSLLFDAPGTSGPRVFTIAPGAPFLDTLAGTLMQALASPDDPFAMADAVVLVPTRRAARELVGAFLRASDGAPPATLLPTIRPLGDIDENEPPFEPGALTLNLPAAVSTARRRFELAALLARRDVARGVEANLVGALALADDLGALFDELAEFSSADLDGVSSLAAALPEHFQDAAQFVSIVRAHWPARLQELGRIDPGARHVAVAQALAQSWREAPPAGPIIAAGSTGSNPSTAALLSAIARAPRGCVVLPGLDRELDDAAWDSLDHAHPQRALAHALAAMDTPRASVRPWPGAALGPAARARQRVINEALRPAPATADWLTRIAELRSQSDVEDPIRRGFDGVSLVEAPDEEAEAQVVALCVREALEAPEKSVLLVTPDRAIVTRVARTLEQWGVQLDASFGAPVAETRAGALLALSLACVRDPGGPIAISALATHPDAAFGLDAQDARAAYADLDARGLRGVRPPGGWDGLRTRLGSGGSSATMPGGDCLERIIDALTPLQEACQAGRADVATFARAHAESCERIATTPDTPGAERMWRDADGEAAAALLRDLMSEAEALPDLTLDDYARVLERLMRAASVRGPIDPDVRARAVPPVEARLLSADRVILAGLNEGVWPAPVVDDAFMSRGMRETAGLPDRERRIGQAAHDFAQLACAPEVLLTRAIRIEGTPTVASRWIWRLRALADGAQTPDALTPQSDWLALAGLSAVSGAGTPDAGQTAVARVRRPAPRPPVEARPVKLSVSRVREWMRDPYGLYARSILKLRALDPPDRAPDAREHGVAVHHALEVVLGGLEPDAAITADLAAALSAEALQELARMGANADVLARAAPRLERAGETMAEWEREQRGAGWRPAAFEAQGAWTFETLAGSFTVTAIADRIDAGPEGYGVIDYKTGKPPTLKMMAAGLEPQLPLEAAILAHGGFEGLSAGLSRALVYVRVRGGEAGVASATPAAGEGVDELVAHTIANLRKRVESYADPAIAYRPQTRAQSVKFIGDYDRLSRRREWAAVGGDDE